VRQLETTLTSTPKKLATAVDPPQQSMASLGVLICSRMSLYTPRLVGLVKSRVCVGGTMYAYVQESTSMARGIAYPSPESISAIGFRLKCLRKGLGLTQAFMSQEIGASRDGQTWQNYEKGLRRIEIDYALVLCRTRRVTLHWIYQGVMDLPPSVASIVGAGELRIAEEEAKKSGKARKRGKSTGPEPKLAS